MLYYHFSAHCGAVSLSLVLALLGLISITWPSGRRGLKTLCSLHSPAEAGAKLSTL